MAHSVVLFGGTFDPPHVGHITMAQMAIEQTDASMVWFLPSPDPPHKVADEHLPYSLRASMVDQMVLLMNPERDRFQVSTIEEGRDGPSYTVDTVKIAKKRFPSTRFSFLIGTDSLHDLPTWHRADELVREIEFLVVPRSDYPFQSTLASVQSKLPDIQARFIRMPMLDVSSTWVRQRWNEGKPLCGLVPDEVVAFLPKQGGKTF